MQARFIKSLAFTALIAALGGCTTATFYADNRMEANQDLDKINSELEKHSYKKVFSMERPPIQIQKFEEPYQKTWLDEEVSFFANGTYLAQELDKLIDGNTPVRYGVGVDTHQEIFLKHSGTVREILNLIAVQTNYGITPNEDGIDVQQYISKTYMLPAIIGSDSFQIGSAQGGGDATNEEALEGDVSKTGASDGQHANSAGKDFNLTVQIKDGITSILNQGNEEPLGYVKEIPGTASIVVRTSPHLMKEVDQFMDAQFAAIEKSVDLDIKVIQYQADQNSEFGLDAELAFEDAMNKVTLGLSGPSIQDVVGGTGLGLEIKDGKFAGSTAFLKALRETGTVAVDTSTSIQANNFKLQEIDLSETLEYVSQTSVTYEGDNATPIIDVTKATVRDGVKMTALPTIGKNSVHLKLNGILTKFIRFDEQEIQDVITKSPQTRQALINVSGSYEYNRPIIVAHLRQRTSESASSGFADVQIGNSGKNTVIDTIVLLTPRRTLETR